MARTCVGRNYMFHNARHWWPWRCSENPTLFQKTLTINDFYFGAPDYEFPMGNIQMIGKSQGPMFRDDAPRFAPGFALDEWPGIPWIFGSRPRTCRSEEPRNAE